MRASRRLGIYPDSSLATQWEKWEYGTSITSYAYHKYYLVNGYNWVGTTSGSGSTGMRYDNTFSGFYGATKVYYFNIENDMSINASTGQITISNATEIPNGAYMNRCGPGGLDQYIYNNVMPNVSYSKIGFTYKTSFSIPNEAPAAGFDTDYYISYRMNPIFIADKNSSFNTSDNYAWYNSVPIIYYGQTSGNYIGVEYHSYDLCINILGKPYNGYWYTRASSYDTHSQSKGNIYHGIVENKNPNAYPENGLHTDGYWYMKIGSDYYATDLPSEYTRVSWIKGNGGQYINLGHSLNEILVTNTSTSYIKIWYKTDSSTITEPFYGAITSDTNSEFSMWLDSGNIIYNVDGTSYILTESGYVTNGNIHLAAQTFQRNSVALIDDSDNGHINSNLDVLYNEYYNWATYNPTNQTNPLYLFGINNDNTVSSAKSSTIKIYLFQIYMDSVVVPTYKYIPCIRKSDNAVGLYEVNTQTFYGNSSGTGYFTAGYES